MRDARFFTALENGHSVAAACKAARYSRARVYVWRREDPAFAEQWDISCTMAGDLLEGEADRRGRNGYAEPVYHRGKETGTRRRYSDSLLLARLKALKPESYRDKAKVDALPHAPMAVVHEGDAILKKLIDEKRVSPDDLDERLRRRLTQNGTTP